MKLKNMFNKVDGIETETNSSEIKSSMTTNDSGHRAMETEMDQQIPSMEMPPTSSYGMIMTSQYQPYDIAGYSLNQ